MTSVIQAEDEATPGASTREVAAERMSICSTLAWAGFGILFLYAVVVGGGWFGIYSVGVRELSLGLTLVALAGWLVAAWRRPTWRPATAIWPAFVLPIFAMTLSALTSSDQRVGAEYVAWAILVTALYLLLVRVMSLPSARARIGGLAALIGLLVGSAYIIWVLALWIEWWGLVGEFRPPPLRPFYLGLTWGNPSAILTVEVLLWAIAVAGLGLATKGVRTTLSILTVVTVATIIMSGSRAGWIAVAGALAIVGGLLLYASWNGPATRSALSSLVARRRVRVALALTGVAVIGVGVLFAPGILARVDGGGDGGRFVYYAVALRMLAASPLLGLGPGSWAAHRAEYTEAGELDFVIPHAHNIYLHTAAELGVVGLAVGVIAFACVGWLAYGAIRGTDPIRRRWAWATVFVFVYLAIHDLFDYYANMPAVFLLAATPVAVLDATSDRPIGLPRALWAVSRPLRALAVAFLVVGSAVAVSFLARSESIASTHQKAVALLDDSDWEAAFTPAMEAAQQDPEIAPYQQTLGLAAAGAKRWDVAAEAYAAAAALDDVASNWLGLAFAQQQLGASPEVVSGSLERAMRLGVQQPSLAFVAAELYDEIGDARAADDRYVDALIGLPELAGSSWWTRDPSSSARFKDLLSRAIEASPATAWELALMSGDLSRARALVEGDATRLMIVDAWSGDDAAIARLKQTADEHVFDGWLLGWAGSVMLQVGDEDGARRYDRLIEIGLRGAKQSVEADIGKRVPKRDGALGTNSFAYGNYMHRRTTPVEAVVPGLPAPIIVERHEATESDR